MRSGAELWRRVRAVARLVRLHNGAIAAAGVLVGAWWADPRSADSAIVLAGIMAVALTCFANAVNDWCDVEVDSVAHPHRPLPRGELSRTTALVIAVVAGVSGVVLSAVISAWMAVASTGVLALMLVYSTHLKRHGVAGNAVVALLASLPFLYGAWSAGHPAAAWPLLLVAAPLHFAREVAKDLDDVEGDRGARSTLPIAVGERISRQVFAAAMAVFLLALAPLVAEQHVLAALVAPAVIISAVAFARVMRGRPGGAMLLKTAMVCAMISLLVVRP